jgi:hypothetical protein
MCSNDERKKISASVRKESHFCQPTEEPTNEIQNVQSFDSQVEENGALAASIDGIDHLASVGNLARVRSVL